MARSPVSGVSETIRNLKQVASLVAPAANEASKRALEPTLAAAKDNVPKRLGLLKRSLILRRLKSSPKMAPVYVVTVKAGSRARRYAHVAEFGRAPNADGKGAVRGSRAVTNAFESTKDAALKIWGATFGPALEKSAARLAARAKRGR